MPTFDNIFETYIAEMLEDTEKKEVVEKYYSLFPNEKGKTIFEQTWYNDYTSEFKVIDYAVSEETKDDFDFDLLQRLAASSFSSEVQFIDNGYDQKPEFKISVENEGKSIAKVISELWDFQILRLYEIYIEESMNFAIHHAEDERERDEIDSQRRFKLKKWKSILFKAKMSQQFLETVAA